MPGRPLGPGARRRRRDRVRGRPRRRPPRVRQDASRRAAGLLHHRSHRPRAGSATPRRDRRCPRCSRLRRRRRTTSCSSGSTRARPQRRPSAELGARSPRCTGRRAGVRPRGPPHAPAAAGCPTSRARPGPSSTRRNRLLPARAARAATADALPTPRSTRSNGSPARLDRFGGADEPPARLHGDLWAGNRLVDARGRSWLIDPAAHGGHREFDLAMMRLFGGFGAELLRRLRRRVPARRRVGGRVAAPPDRAAGRARDQVRRRLRAARPLRPSTRCT